jgi:hypothetical protein
MKEPDVIARDCDGRAAVTGVVLGASVSPFPTLHREMNRAAA